MSNSDAQASAIKKRPYRLRDRALKQAETRSRIIEAAVDLHGTLGPASTTVTQIAERAGVQRHTYYAHFPDERSLFLACSGLAMGRDPLPKADGWRSLPRGRERVLEGLAQMYAWFERNQEMAACVLRDAEYHSLTREMVQLRMSPAFVETADVLGEDLAARQRALLGVALDFACWRSLSQALAPAPAAALMTDAIFGLLPDPEGERRLFRPAKPVPNPRLPC